MWPHASFAAQLGANGKASFPGGSSARLALQLGEFATSAGAQANLELLVEEPATTTVAPAREPRLAGAGNRTRGPKGTEAFLTTADGKGAVSSYGTRVGTADPGPSSGHSQRE
jgi:hypothetical protein